MLRKCPNTRGYQTATKREENWKQSYHAWDTVKIWCIPQMPGSNLPCIVSAFAEKKSRTACGQIYTKILPFLQAVLSSCHFPLFPEIDQCHPLLIIIQIIPPKVRDSQFQLLSGPGVSWPSTKIGAARMFAVNDVWTVSTDQVYNQCLNKNRGVIRALAWDRKHVAASSCRNWVCTWIWFLSIASRLGCCSYALLPPTSEAIALSALWLHTSQQLSHSDHYFHEIIGCLESGR